RPNIITPDYSGITGSYKSPASSFSQLPGQIVDVIQKKKQQKQWQEAITQMVGQNPQMAPYAQLFSQKPELIGQLMPGLMKSQSPSSSAKVPASIWMNPQDPTDLSPTKKPGYMEYKTTS